MQLTADLHGQWIAGGEIALRAGVGGEHAPGTGVEVRVSASGLTLLDDPPSGESPLETTALGGRVGVRYSAELVSLRLNVGGGVSPFGGFVVPTLGIVVGDSTPFVGFWAGFDLGMSVPIEPRAVVLEIDRDMPVSLAPAETLIATLSAGLRFPFTREQEGQLHPAFLAGGTWSILSEPRWTRHYLGFLAGLSFPL